MTAWERIIDLRRYSARMAVLMLILALATAIPGLWGVKLEVPASTLFIIFGMWLFSAHGMLGQLADAQARWDMRAAGRNEPPEP